MVAFSNIFFWNFHPYIFGEDEPNLTGAYFSDGLVQPPTRLLLGPLCGLIGASRLKRSLVLIFVVSCAIKAVIQVSYALYSGNFWTILFAFLQGADTKLREVLRGVSPIQSSSPQNPDPSWTHAVGVFFGLIW